MNIEKEILDANKAGNIILGFKECSKFLKSGKPKLVVIANNLNENIRKKIEYNAKIAGVRLEVIDRGSKELGILCGKPYPVSVLIIK